MTDAPDGMSDAPLGNTDGERGAVRALAAELEEARREFFAVLDAVPQERHSEARLIGEWGARELVAHLGYWVGHALDSLHAVEHGRGDEFDVGADEVDARNAAVARVARQTNLATVRRREEASFRALLHRLERLDPRLLDAMVGDWGRLGEGIREDGPVHYREHARQLRAVLSGRPEGG